MDTCAVTPEPITLADEPTIIASPVTGEGGAVLLPHVDAAVPVARRALVHDLRRDNVADHVVSDIAVVASELLGNAVRHGSPLGNGDLLLRWRVHPREVSVAVVDGGGGELVEKAPSTSATGGRGLGIVAALSHRWGSSTDEGGRRTVWASLATTDPADVAASLLSA